MKKTIILIATTTAFLSFGAQAGILGSIFNFFKDVFSAPIEAITPPALKSPKTLVECSFTNPQLGDESYVKVQENHRGELFVYVRAEDKHTYVQASGNVQPGFVFLNLDNVDLLGTLQIGGPAGNLALRTKSVGLGEFNDAITACDYTL